MKYIVSYSGGIGSAITAQMVVDKYGAENTVLLFSDTNMEDPDLYRFNKDVSNLLQVPITRIADGRTPWEVFEDVKFIGNSRIDPCSQILKRELIKKWIPYVKVISPISLKEKIEKELRDYLNL